MSWYKCNSVPRKQFHYSSADWKSKKHSDSWLRRQTVAVFLNTENAIDPVLHEEWLFKQKVILPPYYYIHMVVIFLIEGLLRKNRLLCVFRERTLPAFLNQGHALKPCPARLMSTIFRRSSEFTCLCLRTTRLHRWSKRTRAGAKTLTPALFVELCCSSVLLTDEYGGWR